MCCEDTGTLELAQVRLATDGRMPAIALSTLHCPLRAFFCHDLYSLSYSASMSVLPLIFKEGLISILCVVYIYTWQKTMVLVTKVWLFS